MGYDSMQAVKSINSKQELKEIGVVALGHRGLIISEIKKLNGSVDDHEALQIKKHADNRSEMEEYTLEGPLEHGRVVSFYSEALYGPPPDIPNIRLKANHTTTTGTATV